MTSTGRRALVAAAALALLAAVGASRDWSPGIPSPPGNPLTAEKAELGRHLFHDRRLSGTGRVSCAGCHRPERAFTDARPRSIGPDGRPLTRAAPSLANLAWARALTWADPRIDTLEAQARVALFGTDPVEMGAHGHEEEIERRILAEPRYGPLFRDAFPDEPRPVTIANVVLALASFERTLVSLSSPYDRLVLFDERDALRAEARRGMELFFSRRAGCSRCHAGLAFTDASRLRRPVDGPVPFYRTRLLAPPGSGDPGLARVSGRAADRGKFRVPTLRNVAVTAPYMHDGRHATLRDVVAEYDRGGQPALGRPGGVAGDRNPHAAIRPLGLDEDETRALVRFLESLTDARFLADPRHRDPWAAGSPPQKSMR